MVFEAFTLAQPERGPHCHGGGLETGVEADDAVLRCATPLDVAGPLAVAKKADTPASGPSPRGAAPLGSGPLGSRA